LGTRLIKWVLLNPRVVAFIVTFIVRVVQALWDREVTSEEMDDLSKRFIEFVKTEYDYKG